MLKFAAFEVTSAVLVPRNAGPARLSRIRREAHRHHFDYQPRPGYLYVRCRAISSRTNDNYDEFPAAEIKKAYKTFIGKPVFVNHVNDNHRLARGVIIDAVLHEDRLADGSPDTWAELLQEIDAIKFPKLTKAILSKRIDRTSMGCDVDKSVCSMCGNEATTPAEYCHHIPRLKGKKVLKRNASTGAQEEHLIRETCYGLRFFENSLLVEPPADPTAFFTGVDDHSGLAMAASRKTAGQEFDWDTGKECLNCGEPIHLSWMDSEGNDEWHDDRTGSRRCDDMDSVHKTHSPYCKQCGSEEHRTGDHFEQVSPQTTLHPFTPDMSRLDHTSSLQTTASNTEPIDLMLQHWDKVNCGLGHNQPHQRDEAKAELQALRDAGHTHVQAPDWGAGQKHWKPVHPSTGVVPIEKAIGDYASQAAAGNGDATGIYSPEGMAQVYEPRVRALIDLQNQGFTHARWGRDYDGDEVNKWHGAMPSDQPTRYSSLNDTDPLDTSQCVSRKDNPTFCLWHKSEHLEPNGEPRGDIDGHAKPVEFKEPPRCDLCNGLHDSLHHYDSEMLYGHHEDESVLNGIPVEGSLIQSFAVAEEEDELDAPCLYCQDYPEPHTSREHFDKNQARGLDVWGRPIKKPYDGHGAWDCNNYDCTEHPSQMYEQGVGMPGWMKHDLQPSEEKDLGREIGKHFHDQGMTEDARYLLDQQDQGPSKYSFIRAFGGPDDQPNPNADKDSSLDHRLLDHLHVQHGISPPEAMSMAHSLGIVPEAGEEEKRATGQAADLWALTRGLHAIHTLHHVMHNEDFSNPAGADQHTHGLEDPLRAHQWGKAYPDLYSDRTNIADGRSSHRVTDFTFGLHPDRTDAEPNVKAHQDISDPEDRTNLSACPKVYPDKWDQDHTSDDAPKCEHCGAYQWLHAAHLPSEVGQVRPEVLHERGKEFFDRQFGDFKPLRQSINSLTQAFGALERDDPNAVHLESHPGHPDSPTLCNRRGPQYKTHADPSHATCEECLAEHEGGQECDDPYCQETGFEDGWHTKAEHIDPSHLDPGHPDYHDAQNAVEDVLGDHPLSFLLEQNEREDGSNGPSKYSSLTQAYASAYPQNHTHLGGDPYCAECGEHRVYHPHLHTGQWARCSTCKRDMSDHLHDPGRYEHLEQQRHTDPLANTPAHVEHLFNTLGTPYGTTEDDEWGKQKCDHPNCEPDADHTRDDHIRSAVSDAFAPLHEALDANEHIEDAFKGFDDAGWLLDQQPGKPTKYSMQDYCRICSRHGRNSDHTPEQHHDVMVSHGWSPEKKSGYDQAEADCPHQTWDAEGRCQGCGYSAFDWENLSESEKYDSVTHELEQDFPQHGDADWLLGQQPGKPSKYSSLVAMFAAADDESATSLTRRFASGFGKDEADQWTTCGQGHTHWGAAGAAGLLIRHTDDRGTHRYLLQHRAPWIPEGDTWGIPAGALHYDESPKTGAVRESLEELGGLPHDMQHLDTHTDDHGGWAFHTVMMQSPSRWGASGGADAAHEVGAGGTGWFTAEQMAEMKLHPGFAKTWDSTLKAKMEPQRKQAGREGYLSCVHCGEPVAHRDHKFGQDWTHVDPDNPGYERQQCETTYEHAEPNLDASVGPDYSHPDPFRPWARRKQAGYYDDHPDDRIKTNEICEECGKPKDHIHMPQETQDFLRSIVDANQMRDEMYDHAQKRTVNLNDPADLRSHLMTAHGYDESDFWRNSHDEDHPALRPFNWAADEDDRPLTHGEVRDLHDWEHGHGIANDHPDYDGGMPGTFMGHSHFHTASLTKKAGAKNIWPIKVTRLNERGEPIAFLNYKSLPGRFSEGKYPPRSQFPLRMCEDHLAEYRSKMANHPTHKIETDTWPMDSTNTEDIAACDTCTVRAVNDAFGHTGVRKQADVWGHSLLRKTADEDQCPHCGDDGLMRGGVYHCQGCGKQFPDPSRHPQNARDSSEYTSLGPSSFASDGGDSGGVSSSTATRRTAAKLPGGFLEEESDPQDYWAKPNGKAPYDPLEAHHGLAEHEEGHGPWNVVRSPETRAYHVIDNQGRSAHTVGPNIGLSSYEMHDTNAWRNAHHIAIQANQDHGHIPKWVDRDGREEPETGLSARTHMGRGLRLPGCDRARRKGEPVEDAFGIDTQHVISHFPKPEGIETTTEDPRVAEYKQRAADHPAPQVYPAKTVQASSSREHGTTYRQVRHGDPDYDAKGAFHDPSPEDEWHGPYRVIQHPETHKYHVADNQDRITGYGGRDGVDEQHRAEYLRDYADGRQASKERARGIAESLWEGFNQAIDPGSTPEGRRTDRYAQALDQLATRYHGGDRHSQHPGRFDWDDEDEDGDKEGRPYYEVKHPSGFTLRDYGGGNAHVYHEATPDEAHDLIRVTDSTGWDSPEKPEDYGHDALTKELHTWVHGKPHDPRYPDDTDPDTGRGYSPAKHIAENDPRISRWQRRNGYHS